MMVLAGNEAIALGSLALGANGMISGLATAALVTRYLLPELVPAHTRDTATTAGIGRLWQMMASLPRPRWYLPSSSMLTHVPVGYSFLERNSPFSASSRTPEESPRRRLPSPPKVPGGFVQTGDEFGEFVFREWFTSHTRVF